MSKRLYISAAIAALTLTALPAASQATDCLRLKRVETRTTAVVHDTGRAMTRIGDGIVRTGDRLFGWIFCDHRRRRI